jgi:hypothetical protein
MEGGAPRRLPFSWVLLYLNTSGESYNRKKNKEELR